MCVGTLDKIAQRIVDIIAEVLMSRVLKTNPGSQTCSPCSVNRHINMDV
jgi:hypothetical protein